MSSFDGVVREYDGIIIDQFCAANCRQGKAFFLSHCHKDHMANLTSTELTATLRSGGAKGLYCSVTTRDLLKADRDFEHLRHYMVGLPVDEPVSIQYTADELDDSGRMKSVEVSVTLVPAGHCPGSVMFLFEGKNGNVLYTGDFRYALGDSARLVSLQSPSGGPKDLLTVYVDTTFCHPVAEHIPSRTQSREIVLQKTRHWLARGDTYYVVVRTPTFGYEHIWIALSEQFGCPVHVSDRVYSYYEHALPEVACCLTTDPTKTRIHACKWDSKITSSFRSYLPCGHVPSSGVPAIYRIRLSVMGFARSNNIPASGYVEHDTGCHVVHSMHASYGEIRDILRFLRPRRIQACVVPAIPKREGAGKMSDAEERLKDLLRDSVEGACSFDASSCSSACNRESTVCFQRQASWPSTYSFSENVAPASKSSVSRASQSSEKNREAKENTPVPNLSHLFEDGEEGRALPLPPKRRRHA